MQAKTVKISDKGQISIPKDIRDELGLNKGDELLLVMEGDIIIIEKIKKENFRDLLKLSEKTAAAIWDNDEDEVWNDI